MKHLGVTVGRYRPRWKPGTWVAERCHDNGEVHFVESNDKKTDSMCVFNVARFARYSDAVAFARMMNGALK